MAFTLYALIQAVILGVNAVAVLHEERFLSKSNLFYTGNSIARVSYVLCLASLGDESLWSQTNGILLQSRLGFSFIQSAGVSTKMSGALVKNQESKCS